MNMSSTVPRTTAVVVTYQSAHTVADTLASVRRCHEAGVLECVTVDNGSTDGTVESLSGYADWVDIVLTGKNNGFGRGCNVGLSKVTTEFTLFLNPDAQIEPASVRELVAFMDAHPEAGIAGPATVTGGEDQPKGFQCAGPLQTPWSILRSSIPLLAKPQYLFPIIPGDAPTRTGWVCGGVMMIRTDLAKKLGGFDPRFFLYWEETDLCRRALASGFETWAVGTAAASHICHASSANDDRKISGCISKYFYQSRRYYMIKHHGWIAATLAELTEVGFLLVRAFIDIVTGKGIARLRPRLEAPILSQPEQPPADALSIFK